MRRLRGAGRSPLKVSYAVRGHGGFTLFGPGRTHRATIVFIGAVLLGSAGCDQDLCADGAYGTVVLGSQGFVVEGPKCDPFGCTDEVVIPYSEGSPFESCTSIGSLFVRDFGAVVESDHYPDLEELGGIVIEPAPTNNSLVVDEIDGFNKVIVFGGVTDSFGGNAPVGDIHGFESLSFVDGSLFIQGEIQGMQQVRGISGGLAGGHRGLQRLERIGGLLTLNGETATLDFPNLVEVGGDVTITRIRDIPTLGIPSLQRIGGSVLVRGNQFSHWSGFAQRAEILGSLDISTNRGITNENFLEWVQASQTTIQGYTRLCDNVTTVTEGDESCIVF